MKSPILGSSYVARSVNAADNRMVNLFPEVVPEGGKEPLLALRSAANGSFEVVFRAGISGKVLAHAELVRLLHQGRQIAAGATDS